MLAPGVKGPTLTAGGGVHRVLPFRYQRHSPARTAKTMLFDITKLVSLPNLSLSLFLSFSFSLPFSLWPRSPTLSPLFTSRFLVCRNAPAKESGLRRIYTQRRRRFLLLLLLLRFPLRARRQKPSIGNIFSLKSRRGRGEKRFPLKCRVSLGRTIPPFPHPLTRKMRMCVCVYMPVR